MASHPSRNFSRYNTILIPLSECIVASRITWPSYIGASKAYRWPLSHKRYIWEVLCLITNVHELCSFWEPLYLHYKARNQPFGKTALFNFSCFICVKRKGTGITKIPCSKTGSNCCAVTTSFPVAVTAFYIHTFMLNFVGLHTI